MTNSLTSRYYRNKSSLYYGTHTKPKSAIARPA